MVHNTLQEAFTYREVRIAMLVRLGSSACPIKNSVSTDCAVCPQAIRRDEIPCIKKPEIP